MLESLPRLTGLRRLGHGLGPPAVFPLSPQVFEVWHDLLSKELRVLKGEIMGNIAEVLQDHELADVHAL